jgi:hypothetical protein
MMLIEFAKCAADGASDLYLARVSNRLAGKDTALTMMAWLLLFL